MSDAHLSDDAFVNSIIGEGTRFKGEFDLNGLLRIDGDFSGVIRTRGKVLVGRNGRAECTMHAGTVVVGGSFGAGNYALCGKAYDPRFIFAWPTARTAVMGGAQAAQVMDIVNRAKIERTGMTANIEIRGETREQVLDRIVADVRRRLAWTPEAPGLERIALRTVERRRSQGKRSLRKALAGPEPEMPPTLAPFRTGP